MEFPVNIRNGRCDLRAFIAYITGLFGDYVIKVEKPQRTVRQNRYLWGVIYPMLLIGLRKIGYDFKNTDEVHEFMGFMRGKDIVNRYTGDSITIPMSTKEMTTVQMNNYCEELRDFARNELKTEIPDPEPIYKI